MTATRASGGEAVLPSQPEVRGVEVDARTGCAHYRSERDIIAIKMACCDVYYACKDCHDALADHAIKTWPRKQWSSPAVLCGSCKTELTIDEYLGSGNVCPRCGAAFNPGCSNHYNFYFTMQESP